MKSDHYEGYILDFSMKYDHYEGLRGWQLYKTGMVRLKIYIYLQTKWQETKGKNLKTISCKFKFSANEGKFGNTANNTV